MMRPMAAALDAKKTTGQGTATVRQVGVGLVFGGGGIYRDMDIR
jgi:hypothetical protein